MKEVHYSCIFYMKFVTIEKDILEYSMLYLKAPETSGMYSTLIVFQEFSQNVQSNCHCQI